MPDNFIETVTKQFINIWIPLCKKYNIHISSIDPVAISGTALFRCQNIWNHTQCKQMAELIIRTKND